MKNLPNIVHSMDAKLLNDMLVEEQPEPSEQEIEDLNAHLHSKLHKDEDQEDYDARFEGMF